MEDDESRADIDDESPAEGNNSDSGGVITVPGQKIRVRFQEPAKWYSGIITQVTSHHVGKKLSVTYEDGTTEDIVFCGNNENISIEGTPKKGEILWVEYEGDGEYLCRLVVRNNMWVVQSADDRFTEEVPFDPKVDSWRRFKMSSSEKKALVEKLQKMDRSVEILSIVRETSPGTSIDFENGCYEIRMKSLPPVTLVRLQKLVKNGEKKQVKRRRRDRDNASWQGSETETESKTSGAASDIEKEYPIENVCGKKVNAKGETEYLVKWAGYEAAYNSWEPEMNLSGVPKLIQEFHERQSRKQKNSKGNNKRFLKVWTSARAIISQLKRHTAAKPFIEPIDQDAPFAKEYNEMIKEPMDLTTISEKLGKNNAGFPSHYHNPSELLRDLKLIWDNAK
eukprot:493394-Amorphochlora_amoeboformis.AAC.3